MLRTISRKHPRSIIEKRATHPIFSSPPARPRPLSHSAAQLTTPGPPNPARNRNSTSPPSPSPFNIWAQIRSSPRPIRYTLYTASALAATAETTFWLNVIYARWFAGEQDREKADELLERFTEAVRGYRVRYLANYASYYSNGVWGL
ncbi:hypothetical protein PSPO01_07093 [Paraphaeosphaeria sporulosa]